MLMKPIQTGSLIASPPGANIERLYFSDPWQHEPSEPEKLMRNPYMMNSAQDSEDPNIDNNPYVIRIDQQPAIKSKKASAITHPKEAAVPLNLPKINLSKPI